MTITTLLVAQTAIAHGDPGASNSSNVTPFRMQEILYERPMPLTPVADDDEPIGNEPATLRVRNLKEAEYALISLAQQFPLPADSALSRALEQLQAEEFVASAFVYALISQLNALNGGDGEGLFTGKERYDMLLKRLSIVSSQFNTSFFSLYSSLLNELRVESVLSRFVEVLAHFASLPRSVQQSAIAILGKERQSVITIARTWFNEVRALRDTNPDWEQFRSILYDPRGHIAGSSIESALAAIPHISSNSFRHSIFRETLWQHLLQACDLGSPMEVNTLLPPYVTMLFSNGGNQRADAKVPDNSEAINMAIMRHFPSLELVSGCLPSHIMGEGALRLANWTLCLQNNEATEPLGYTSDIDASSLLSIATHTRHTPTGMEHSKEAGQMLFAHTVMKQGSRVLLQFGFQPFASDLAKGAAYFAFRQWLSQGGQVGGHDGTGEGRFRAMLIQGTDESDELAEAYEEYIGEHAEVLRTYLLEGTLGWRERLKSWG